MAVPEKPPLGALSGFSGWRRAAAAGLGLASSALLALFDYYSGIEVPLSVFYLIPISLVTWYSGLGWGLVLSLTGALSYCLTQRNLLVHQAPWLLVAVGTVSRLVFFGVVAFILAKLRQYLRQEIELARTDALTGAANARLFYERAEWELARSRRYRHPISIIYFDVDNFKEINDSYGHQVGDMVLQETVREVRHIIRDTDLLARIGGDEFVVLMPETGERPAEAVIDKVRQKVLQLEFRKQYPVTFSFGLVTFMTPPATVANMVFWADRKMYQAKGGGKNQVRAQIIE